MWDKLWMSNIIKKIKIPAKNVIQKDKYIIVMARQCDIIDIGGGIMEDKTLSQVQSEVDNWAGQFEKPYFAPLSRMAAMTEEVGEVARVVNRIYGDKPNKDTENLKDLEEELGDLLFTLVCMANAEKIDLTKAYKRKMDKVLKRDTDRFKKKK